MNKEVREQFKGIRDVYSLQCLCNEQYDEIERLNYIIEQFEKWLEIKIDYFDKTAKDTILHEHMVIRIIYDYLQELKEYSSIFKKNKKES